MTGAGVGGIGGADDSRERDSNSISNAKHRGSKWMATPTSMVTARNETRAELGEEEKGTWWWWWLSLTEGAWMQSWWSSRREGGAMGHARKQMEETCWCWRWWTVKVAVAVIDWRVRETTIVTSKQQDEAVARTRTRWWRADEGDDSSKLMDDKEKQRKEKGVMVKGTAGVEDGVVSLGQRNKILKKILEWSDSLRSW